MNFQNQYVACIRKTADGWAAFEEQPVIRALPKRHDFSMVPKSSIGLTMDSRVYIGIRRSSEDAARWATYTAIMQIFLDSTEDWLLLIEEGVAVHRLPFKQPAAGLTILGHGVLLLDRITAKIIVRNLRLYYAPIDVMLKDLETLRLLNLTEDPIYQPQPPSLYQYTPLILSVAAAALLLCPPNRLFRSK